jgi:two-component system nitrogen regulation response regulator GlnG
MLLTATCMAKRRISVIHLDDNLAALRQMKKALEGFSSQGKFALESFQTVESYRERIEVGPVPELVILDFHLEDAHVNGFSLTQETRKRHPGAVILLCSSADDGDTVVNCLSAGADDFISKNSDTADLSSRVLLSYQFALMKRIGDPSRQSSQFDPHRPVPLTVGATMERFKRRVPLLLSSAITSILIEGESGTGKEVIADLVEAFLPEKMSFIRVNCAAIAPTLMASELFGHKKSAFTGAHEDKTGLLQQANGGWLFLDEIASLTLDAQAALLRVIENNEIRRVGETKLKKIQVRFISATNEPLQELVKKGLFRKDLWQRLSEAEIKLTPLRERAEEIPELIRHFCRTMPGGPYRISTPAMEMLTRYSWNQGNIREVRNCLKAMTELQMNQLLSPLSVPDKIWKRLNQKKPKKSVRAIPEAVEGKYLMIPWLENQERSFDLFCDHLFFQAIRELNTGRGVTTLKTLTDELRLSRNTVSKRLRRLVKNRLVSVTELSQWVKIHKL